MQRQPLGSKSSSTRRSRGHVPKRQHQLKTRSRSTQASAWPLGSALNDVGHTTHGELWGIPQHCRWK
eukprot:868135-Rhodomonas_salina.1